MIQTQHLPTPRDTASSLVAPQTALTYGNQFPAMRIQTVDILHHKCLKHWFRVTEFKYASQNPSLGEIPIYKYLQLQKGEHNPEAQYFRHLLTTVALSSRLCPCSCPQEQPHQESPQVFEKPAKGWGASDEQEGAQCRQERCRKSLPLLNSVWKAFTQEKDAKKSCFRNITFGLYIVTDHQPGIIRWLGPGYNQSMPFLVAARC